MLLGVAATAFIVDSDTGPLTRNTVVNDREGGGGQGRGHQAHGEGRKRSPQESHSSPLD